MGHPQINLLIQEGVTQLGPLLVVLYRTTFAPLEEELWDADPGFILPFLRGRGGI